VANSVCILKESWDKSKFLNDAAATVYILSVICSTIVSKSVIPASNADTNASTLSYPKFDAMAVKSFVSKRFSKYSCVLPLNSLLITSCIAVTAP